MKAIMYHYVRPDDPELPYFRHLHIEDFAAQLDYFESTFGFVSQQAFAESLATGVPTRGVILTFDDGFKDHVRHVLPELRRRGLWGIFYITVKPYENGQLLDVHRIHMLLGRYGGQEVSAALDEMVNDTMLSHDHVEEFHSNTYQRQKNDASTTYVKRMLNYFIDYRFRQPVLDQLMARFFADEQALRESFYMTSDELRLMRDHGMVLGSHTVHHPVMSRLSAKQQEREIVDSFRVLEATLGTQAWKTFCYPYGGFHNFTPETESLLEKHGCDFSFNVEPRDINSQDLQTRRQALPRFDCNQFPHGSIRPHLVAS